MIAIRQSKLWRQAWWWIGCILVVGLASACTAPLIQTAPSATSEEPAATAEAGTLPAESAPDGEEAAEQAGALEVYKDLPVGFTPEGYPFRGDPDAPVTLYEYSDYECPFCARYFVQTEPALNESYIRAEELRVVFRDFPIPQIHPNAVAAHVAALCVAEQGSAARYWAMHDEIFRTQTVWSNLADPLPHLAELAAELEIDTARFDECVASGTMEAKIEQSINEGRALQLSSTPSFNFVNEETDENFLLIGAQPYDQFASMIDALLAGEQPAQAQQPEQENAQIPFWATAEGLAVDPERPGYTVAGDQYRGNPAAKVAVIEFSDFQCPYCRRHVFETEPLLQSTFVDTDQVFWVFKHFPLNNHPQAPAAGTAAECAADQQQFWAMHDLIFADVESWSIADPTPVFVGYAAELGLDGEQFADCLTNGEALARVQSDLQEGLAFVQGTPTFIVLFNGEGRIIPGALPADQFTEALQQILDLTAE